MRRCPALQRRGRQGVAGYRVSWRSRETRGKVAVLLMVRPRHSALIRALTLLSLLWVGFDLGAHGLFPSDFTPIVTSGSSIRLSLDHGGASAPVAPDHCFCHGTWMGAVVTTPTTGLTPAGTLVPALSPQMPTSEPHPLDRPPQLTA
jgi:hypothetical protein